MKIEREKRSELVALKTVDEGAVIEDMEDNTVYIVTDEVIRDDIRCVDLHTGEMVDIYRGKKVIVCYQARLII